MRRLLTLALLPMFAATVAGCAGDEPAAERAADRRAVAMVQVSGNDMKNDRDHNVEKTDAEWRQELTPEQYRVTRQAGTEPAFSGEYWNSMEPGAYVCICCGEPLFTAEDKFVSACGWPAFSAPADREVVSEHEDRSHGMVRTEVRCRRCDAHLGHVFNDGPPPTGLRYCINSVAIKHIGPDEAARLMEGRGGEEGATMATKKAMFGAGCFWGVEAVFQRIPGVVDTEVGYAGGHVENPTYEQVCTDSTGHAEVVLVEYDPDKVVYGQLLDAFWSNHDPTQLNRQGPDVGAQYRSVIFTFDKEQRQAAAESKAALEASGKHSRPVVTQIEDAPAFYRAEEYHQRYLEKRGQASCKIPQ